MRNRLAIGMILRSDDTVASGGTLATMLAIGMVAKDIGIEQVDYFPLMGAGKDLARAEVLAAYRMLSKADDLLWLDFGNAIPGHEYTANVLQVLLTSEREALYLPYLTRGGDAPSFTASLPDRGGAAKHVEYEEIEEGARLRLLKLGGCGFGAVRMRRSLVDKLYDRFGGHSPYVHEHGPWNRGSDRLFLSDSTQFGELECIDVFSSRLGRRLQDRERPAERPWRLLPEDDTFWSYAREVGVWPYACVDLPVAHGKLIPGEGGNPTFAAWVGLPELEAAEDKQLILTH